MEHSLVWGKRVAVVALDATARLALPASVLALLHGAADYAIGASLVVTVASLGRALLMGLSLEDELVALWGQVVRASRGRSIASLLHRREEDESLSMVIESVYVAASLRATTVPVVIAQALSLLALAAAAAFIVGPSLLLLGICAAIIIGGLLVGAHRRLRRAHQRAWAGFSSLSRDMRVLIEATAELRANGREGDVSHQVVQAATAMARGHRQTATYSAMLALLPAGLAVLGLALPMQGGARWLAELLDADRVAEVILLGGASAAVALSLARSFETVSASAPSRRALQAFLGLAGDAGLVGGSARVVGSIAEVPLRFDKVSVVYPGNGRATPSAFDWEWAPGGGIAIVGPNGSGKSTLAWVLLGFMKPTTGRVRVGEREVLELDLASYRSRIAYAPQDPFVAPGESLGWHLRLLAGKAKPDAELERCIARVGLQSALERHARRSRSGVLDVPVAELSGGERQRMFLARVLLQDAELVVLDEPDAGMDEDGRRILRSILAELVPDRRVLVVVHDQTVVPSSYSIVECSSAQEYDAIQATSEPERPGARSNGDTDLMAHGRVTF